MKQSLEHKLKLDAIKRRILFADKLKLKYETEAVSIIKNKIKHFRKTGNKRKLAIYQNKLKGKQLIISNLRSMIK